MDVRTAATPATGDVEGRRAERPGALPDVIIVGAGPTGLMLAGELGLVGVRALVLERKSPLETVARANGFGGRILELLRYRGLLDRLEAAGTGPSFALPRVPFGGVHLDLANVADPPLRGLSLPQPTLEHVLGDRAGELGADVRRGHEVVGVSQDDSTVTAEVLGPDGSYRVAARYLVGCDGGHSRVRDLTGIPFPGTTYPEVNRLGQVTLGDSVTLLDDGGIDVPGLGRIASGFTRTDRGVFGFGHVTPELLLVQTTEDESAGTDDDAPMTLAEFEDSIRRVLGAALPLGRVSRLSRYGFQARQAERYRDGRILLAGDAAHQFPATGIGINVGMLDAVNLAWKLAGDIHGWAPTGLVDTYHDERHFAGARGLFQTQAQVALRRGSDPAAEALRDLFLELLVDEQPLRRIGALVAGTDIRYPFPNPNHHPMTGTFAPDLPLRSDQGTTSVADLMHPARPVLLDLAGRAELREPARGWQHRVDIHTAQTVDRPADALLIRPDAYIAWAATIDQPADSVALELRDALAGWFGPPRTTS